MFSKNPFVEAMQKKNTDATPQPEVLKPKPWDLYQHAEQQGLDGAEEKDTTGEGVKREPVDWRNLDTYRVELEDNFQSSSNPEAFDRKFGTYTKGIFIFIEQQINAKQTTLDDKGNVVTVDELLEYQKLLTSLNKSLRNLSHLTVGELTGLTWKDFGWDKISSEEILVFKSTSAEETGKQFKCSRMKFAKPIDFFSRLGIFENPHSAEFAKIMSEIEAKKAEQNSGKINTQEVDDAWEKEKERRAQQKPPKTSRWGFGFN